MMKNDLISRFYDDADRLVSEDYNDLTRVDFDWYAERVNEANYDEMLDAIRDAAAFCM